MTDAERRAARSAYQRERRRAQRAAKAQSEAEEVAELEPLKDLSFAERPFRPQPELFQDPHAAEREKFLALPSI